MDRLGKHMDLDSLKAFPKEESQKQSTRIFSNSSIPEIRIELSKVISVEGKHIMLPLSPTNSACALDWTSAGQGVHPECICCFKKLFSVQKLTCSVHVSA